jgi:hypothetical protein
MTEGGNPKAPAWMKDSQGLRSMAGGAGGDARPELCRTALLEIFAYMGLDLDERGRHNLESYDGDQIRDLMVRIQGLLQ